MNGITPFLWFDGQAEEAARFYTSIFPNSKITSIAHYNTAGPGEPGSVMTVEFELAGRPFVGLNGGPEFTFNEAVSFSISCETQAEVDEYWEKLTDGGEPGPCGWLKDRYGLSWQVTPRALPELLKNSDPEAAKRVMETMLQMGKIEIEPLRAAAAGQEVPAAS